MDNIRITDLISEYVQLKKRGGNFVGLCPFHNEKTPSFSVSPARGIFKCFGCGKAGDGVHFIMEHDKLSYPEALRFLAGKYGIEIPREEAPAKDVAAESLRESLYLVNACAAEIFSKSMWEDEKGRAVALAYFRERGMDDKTITKFMLGYNGEDRSSVSDEIVARGYASEHIEKTGIGILKDGKLFDRFRSRVMFPIHNLTGRIIGFGGRTLRSDKEVAKYVNSPESEIYNKGRELYGLFFAKKTITREDECYITEGYTDVISLHQSGIENAVAPLGTSLTDDQVKLIRRYTLNAVLLFDGDEAGRKAAARAIDMLLGAGMNVSIVAFPDGEDSDSFCRKRSDGEAGAYLKSERMNFIAFHMGKAAFSPSMDPVEKAEVMKTVVTSISNISDHLKRSLFVRDLAQRSGVDERSLIIEVNKKRRALQGNAMPQYGNVPAEKYVASPQAPSFPEGKLSDTEKKEERMVEYLLRFGNENVEVAVSTGEGTEEKVKVTVAAYIVNEIEKDELKFRHDGYRRIYELYRNGVEKSELPTLSDFIEGNDSEVRNICIDLLAKRHELSPLWFDRYHISTPDELVNLRTNIERDMYALKLSEVIIRLTDFQEKMKVAGELELAGLMQQQQLLTKAKRALADKLGMIIK